MPFTSSNPVLLKSLTLIPKLVFAIAGALLALMLSGDIKQDGTIKINMTVIFKFFIAVLISLSGGAAFIEHYHLTQQSELAQGFVYLIFAVFGMLVIGIAYRAVEMLNGKSIAEIIKEIKSAFAAILSIQIDYSHPKNDRRKGGKDDN